MANMVNGNIWQEIMALIRFSGEVSRDKQMIFSSRNWVVNQSLVGKLYNLLFVLEILELPGFEKCCCRTLSQVESCLF
jgi:hypothetical protein